MGNRSSFQALIIHIPPVKVLHLNWTRSLGSGLSRKQKKSNLPDTYARLNKAGSGDAS
jgi:hypothetical protein